MLREGRIMVLKDKNIIVVGAGKSGISASKLLSGEDVTITLYDGNEKLDKDELDEAIRQHIRRVYAKYGENVSKAAAALKITRNTLRKYL